MSGSTNAAGAQPGPLPTIVHLAPAPDHYDKGRTQPIRYIILHNTVGVDSRDWLSHSSYPDRVSIPVLVRADGTRYNIVNYGDTAWQVGEAAHGICNANSLGLELESLNDIGRPVAPYPEAQLNTAAHCVATWLYSYGLTWDGAVRRHGDVALPPGRRHDPYGLNMPAFRARAEAWLGWFHALPNDAERARYII